MGNLAAFLISSATALTGNVELSTAAITPWVKRKTARSASVRAVYRVRSGGKLQLAKPRNNRQSASGHLVCKFHASHIDYRTMRRQTLVLLRSTCKQAEN